MTSAVRFRWRSAIIEARFWLVGRARRLIYWLQVAVASLVVPTKKARTFYEAHPQAAVLPDLAALRMVTFFVDEGAPVAEWAAAEATAQEAARRAAASANFGALVQEYEINPAMKAVGGRLGVFTCEAESDLQRAVFALGPNQTSGALRSPIGFHVFKVDAHSRAQRFTFAKARPFIKWGLLFAPEDAAQGGSAPRPRIVENPAA
jgi:hypothetical protein